VLSQLEEFRGVMRGEVKRAALLALRSSSDDKNLVWIALVDIFREHKVGRVEPQPAIIVCSFEVAVQRGPKERNLAASGLGCSDNAEKTV
jgi:hypothetical protein